MISSDDALFGHPSFRYYGWGPRMWTWVQTMGLRKFQEMVFTGRPFTADEMYDCNFLNSVVPRDQLEAEVDKYALACARNRPTDTIFHAEGLLRDLSSSTRASTWAACCPPSSSRWAGTMPHDETMT